MLNLHASEETRSFHCNGRILSRVGRVSRQHIERLDGHGQLEGMSWFIAVLLLVVPSSNILSALPVFMAYIYKWFDALVGEIEDLEKIYPSFIGG